MQARTNDAGTKSHTDVSFVVQAGKEGGRAEELLRRIEATLAPYPIDWQAEVLNDSGGVRSALALAQGEIICVIDVDLRHPPEIAPELVAPVLLGRADLCVGTPGPAAAGHYPRRGLAARFWGALLSLFFPSTRLTADPGSSLFAVRREVLDGPTLRDRGPGSLAEVLVRGRWRTICDVRYRPDSCGGIPHHHAVTAVASPRAMLSLWPPQRSESRRRVAPVRADLLLESREAIQPQVDTVGSGEAA